ncbi:MAG: GGDEF domain-containing protein [Myxococcota bacterium]
MRETSPPTLSDETIRDLTREARTALETIAGYTALFLEDHPDSGDDLDKVSRATNRVRQLIELLEHQVDDARRQASRDPLTGAANRRSLMARGEALFLSDHPLSLLLIDVDKFKDVNDRYGHFVGDEVLKILVDRCRSASRDSDLVARFAGDEFVILLPNTTAADAMVVAERLLNHIAAASFLTSAGTLTVGVSVGVASREPTDPTMEALMRRADEAMYAAKQSGGNRTARL